MSETSPSVTLPFEIDFETADGGRATLEQHRGSVLLLVNVASKCGLTPQYAELEQLQRVYGDRGLQVIGFPCNQFGGQEPGTNEEIQEFCSTTYGVTFPVHGKLEVNGDDRHPLYQALVEAQDESGEAGDIAWNFEKFLIAPDGTVAARIRPRTKPSDPAVIEAIEALLPTE